MHNVIFKIIAHNSPDYKAAVSLREDILRKPLGLTFSQEELEHEKNHIQIAGVMGTEVIATAVLAPEDGVLKMQRVAVREDLQNKGIASAMMTFCEEYACTHGYKEIYCHARDKAVPFYLKNNYIPEGDYFDENTISHLKMRKSLSWDIISATQEEAEFVDNKIVEFNKSQVPFTQSQTLVLKNYVIKDKGIVIAGINACINYWGILYVAVLFVDKSHRQKGLGSALLQKVELEAKTMGATLARLDTFDFQALDFYLNCGYEIFGVLDDCPKGHKRYYLKKSL
ncbi:MAG: GNAT family N-acetyltransferase [Proteobacteria bacterium]|nr:GNAT family N-acetyltransferase [Pseudomonadota bacterium]